MESRYALTAIYLKTPYLAYAGYIQEIPEIDAVHYSLEEVKREIESKLDHWKSETGIDYRLMEENRNF
ncbi:hypothetical protein Q0590_00395 [Rhodocytophaga aerolata]|uniref:Uncharacterized protein n=1 Tax=Rhodocytophaga aerolata TaxID=455078 RepID=A0ABT8R046_9BACT|nr:hypothetical protein [Rhodocytophaga aerolata]MDO1444683.1 hypothetical protein [Rhodocytophaga aerolata]